MTLDFTTEHGKIALDQLENEIAIWLTTVTPKGVPQPNPVWFVWEENSVITWVQPRSLRMRNLAENPQVSLNFSADPDAHHITVLTGVAEIDENIGTFLTNATYMRKYADKWGELGMTPEGASRDFSVPLRVRVESLRGY